MLFYPISNKCYVDSYFVLFSLDNIKYPLIQILFKNVTIENQNQQTMVKGKFPLYLPL